jgi:2-keto-4-pentenoate hydratase/2-oxohepta-3-ene-1,7-dioic acid hydratase in catechol pathway
VEKGGGKVKIVRFKREQEVRHGILDGSTIFSVEGSIFGDFNIGKKLCDLSEVRLLSPVQPKIVVGIGSNYSAHPADQHIPIKPEVFLKPASSVVGHMASIIYPKVSKDVRCGGELAVVMKREARHVTIDKAMEYVLGYTCGNDVTAFDLAEEDVLPTRAKSLYTFCPLGPWISTGIDGDNLRIESRLNRVLMQAASTSNMISSIGKIISFVSEFMLLEPGDVIMTGSPGSDEFAINVGDTVEVEIEGIGVLRNTVVAE